MHRVVRLLGGGVRLSGYLLSIIGVVLFCSVLTVVLPQGKTGKIVGAMARLACIITILAPLPAYFNGNTDGFFQKTSIEMDEDFIKYCSELRIEEAQKNLENSLREKYDENVSVLFYWGWEDCEEGENIKVYQISVSSDCLTEEDKATISRDIKEDYGVEKVVYGLLEE